MPCDLQIAGILLPAPVVCPCPSTFQVDVINLGPDPAIFPAPMKVCLDISVSREGAPKVHLSLDTPPETPPILPGKVRTFTFTNVQIPCGTSGLVKATADCGAVPSVPGNLRTAPDLTVIMPTIIQVPWLWTSMRVGLRDSTGQITWGPGALCPGSTCVVEASIQNMGCAVAVPSVTALELLDGAGASIASFTKGTPAIAAGSTTVVAFSTTLPASAAGKQITFQVCADDGGVVTSQCNRTQGCAQITLPLGVTPPRPKLTFFATRPIFPGEAIPISWRFQNFCSDIGKATARITFQGTVFYTSVAIGVGLQDVEKGEDVDITPPTPTVAANFYKIGTSKLTLEITGTGTDPGPYVATTLVTILAEPVPATWAFTMPAPGTTAAVPWKTPYTVDGRLSNPAHATMTPSSVVLTEASSAFASITRVASPPMGSIVPGGFGTTVWPLIQTWSWLVPGTWLLTGPTSVTFRYSVTFAMQDEFGNAYPAITSPTALVTVTVSGLKIGLDDAAYAMFAVAIGLVIVGFIALAGYITAISAPAIFAAAAAAFTIAAGLGAGALDPPVPDFDYGRVVQVQLPRFAVEVTTHAALAPLLPILALTGRITALTDTLSATEARLIAARIDRSAEATRLQSGEYESLRDSLVSAADQLSFSALEAIDGLRAQPALAPMMDRATLQRTVTAWTRRGLPAKLREAWTAQGLPERQLKDLERALKTKGFVVRSADAVLNDLPRAAARISKGIQEDAERVLDGPVAGT